MVGHGGSSAGSYLADPTSPIPSHCASIAVTSTVGVKWVIIGYDMVGHPPIKELTHYLFTKLYFLFHIEYYFRIKYDIDRHYPHRVGFDLTIPDNDVTFHVTETPALTTWPSND